MQEVCRGGCSVQDVSKTDEREGKQAPQGIPQGLDAYRDKEVTTQSASRVEEREKGERERETRQRGHQC